MSEIEKHEGEITAATVVAAVVDTMRIHDVPVTGRARGMLGRQAKELLADGFAADVVLAACIEALRRGEPHVAHFIAQDIALAQAGQRRTRQDTERALREAQAALDPDKVKIREAMKGAFKK